MRLSQAAGPVADGLAEDFGLDAFQARAETRLSHVPPGPGVPLSNPRGDHDLQPEGFSVAPATPHRPAAVLVPVIDRPEGPTLLFTKRAAHLRDHSGQVAFPGGKVDPEDTTPIDTALREAWEEIGLESDAVLRPNPAEVAAVFEVPLAFLMDPARHLVRSAEWKGRTRYFYAIPFAEHLIWGVTAGIVHNLQERLYP